MVFMKNFILFICLFFVSTVLWSQNDSAHQVTGKNFSKQRCFELGLGFSTLARQDLVFSPFIHRDIAFPAALIGYEAQGKFIHKIGLRYATFSAMLDESYEYLEDGEEETTVPHSFTFVKLDYFAGLTLLTSVKERITGGLSLQWDIHALNYSYGRINSFGYYSGTGLAVSGKYERLISESTTLLLSLQVPLVTWFARSPYLVNDDEFIENISSHKGINTFIAFIGDGKFVTLNRLQRLTTEIGVSHRLSDHWLFGGEWTFDFTHASSPRNMLSYQNTVLAKMIYVL